MEYLVLFIMGLVFGSFVNAFVWRLRAKELHEGTTDYIGQDDEQFLMPTREQIAGSTHDKTSHKKFASTAVGASKSAKLSKTSSKKSSSSKNKKLVDYSILRGRSMCPRCYHPLAAEDLIPVLSWVILKGQCRYCAAPISRQYPIVELLVAVLFVASYWLWPYDFDAYGIFRLAVWLVFLVFFVALSVYDFKWLELPDRVVYVLMVVAGLYVTVSAIMMKDVSLFVGGALGGIIIFGIFYIIYQVSKGEWIGGGDVKLGLVLGFLAGTPLKALLTIFFAAIIGILIAFPTFVRKGKINFQVPFGPALMIGLAVVVFYGDRLLLWYQTLLGV